MDPNTTRAAIRELLVYIDDPDSYLPDDLATQLNELIEHVDALDNSALPRRAPTCRLEPPAPPPARQSTIPGRTALMAHEIETFDDGTAAFFTARTDAWHRLGVVTRDCLTAEQVMTTARLGGWNVRTVPLTATEITADGVTTLPVTDHFATIRTHPSPASPTCSAWSAPATPSCRTRSTANCSTCSSTRPAPTSKPPAASAGAGRPS